MRDFKIVLEPFDLINIIRCEIEKTLNDHAILKIEGNISKETEKEVMQSNLKDTVIELKVFDDDGNMYPIFVGIINTYNISKKADIRTLSLECVTFSYLMDIVKKTRVFQNANSTYNDVINCTCATYSDFSCLMNDGDNISINDLLIQYSETDFQFIKRLASHFNTVICPAYVIKGFKLIFGIPKSNKVIALPESYSYKKDIHEDLKNDDKDISLDIETGSHFIEIESREIHELGDKLSFQNREYIICSIKSSLLGSELIHTYVFREESGIYKSKYYNTKIIGASLESNISDVMTDKVKVLIKSDGIQDEMGWLPYSTVYSSPDGTGWYCMPEVNDSVRLYFPTEKEKHAYIISAVHISDNINATSNHASLNSDSSQTPPRTDPNIKSIKNAEGKEIRLEEGKITLTNNNNMYIELNDNTGIIIFSGKDISIESGGNISVASIQESADGGNINFMASKEIYLNGIADNYIKLSEDTISIEGSTLKVE
ncbi:MAG: phage baseplate assembly protein V [Eubacteriales bacterium]